MEHDDQVQTTLSRPARPGQTEPTRVRYLVLAAICSLAVLTYVHRVGFAAATPAIMKELKLNDEEVGYLTSAFLIAYALFQMPGGKLGDRFGGRNVLTGFVLVWSMLAGAVALAVLLPAGGWLPFAFLLVLRFLFGMVQAGGFPTLSRVLADWIPKSQRGFAQGLVWTFSRLGGALVPLLFYQLFIVFDGWTTPLWLMAGLGLLWCALFWPWFRNRPSEMAQVNEAERMLIEGKGETEIETRRKGDKETRKEAVMASVSPCLPVSLSPSLPLSWSVFLRSRNVWALCLVYGFLGFGGNFFTSSVLTAYLTNHRNFSAQTTAWIFALPLAFGIVSCVLGGYVSDWIVRRSGSRRWGRRLTGSVGLALAGLACLSSIWAEEAWLLGLLFSATFFFNDSSMGPAWAACQDVGERHAGTLSGAMNMCGSLFGAAGVALAGAFFQRHWDAQVFVVFAGTYTLASLCWLAVDVTKPLAPREPAR